MRGMKKIVVKSLLANVERLERQIARMGMEFTPMVWQQERIFVPSDYRPGMNQARMIIRTEVQTTEQPAGYRLFLKRHIGDSGIDIVHETAVADYNETVEIVQQLGFRTLAEISRRRRELRLDEQTVFNLDTVEGLMGTFLKIEVGVGNGSSVDAARKEVFRTLDLLGQETFIMQTYADLMTQQMQPYYLPGKEK